MHSLRRLTLSFPVSLLDFPHDSEAPVLRKAALAPNLVQTRGMIRKKPKKVKVALAAEAERGAIHITLILG